MYQLNQEFNEIGLWKEIKSGNSDSFRTLFKVCYTSLMHYGCKIIPDSELVKECIQEVFVRLWESRSQLADANSPKAYLMISVRREILAQLKSHRLFSDTEVAEASAFQFELNEFENTLNVPVEIREYLLKTINNLPKQQRELIMLFYYNELSYAEVAKVLEISIPSARNLMYRTLIHLRKSIGSKDLVHLADRLF